MAIGPQAFGPNEINLNLPPMTREIIIGSLASATLHYVLFFGPGRRPERTEAITPERERYEIRPFTLPPLEFEPVVVEPTDDKTPKTEIPPPTQIDLPTLILENSFTQILQPPPPAVVEISRATKIIPGAHEIGGMRELTVFDPSMLDHAPVPKFQAPPHYPPDMRRQGISGEVVVDFLLDPHGNVYNAAVLRSSHREFESPALQAVAKWKFRPGRKHGRDVTTHMQVPIVFTLNSE